MAEAEPPAAQRPPVALLGLGTMGEAIALRLLAAGFPLAVWNRTRARAEALAARGARVAASPRDAGRGASVALTLLRDAAAVAEVVLGAEGLLGGLAPGALLADISTVEPESSRQTAAAAAAVGVGFVDVPVYGSRRPAEEGTLVALAGGAPQDLARLAPVLAVIARRTIHAGPVGAGAALKLAVNLSGAHTLVGLATGLALARRAGIDGALFLDALAAGAFASPLVELKGRKMLARDYAPAFSLDLARKDVGLALEEARGRGLPTGVLESIAALLDRARERGLGAADLAAVYEALDPSV